MMEGSEKNKFPYGSSDASPAIVSGHYRVTIYASGQLPVPDQQIKTIATLDD